MAGLFSYVLYSILGYLNHLIFFNLHKESLWAIKLCRFWKMGSIMCTLWDSVICNSFSPLKVFCASSIHFPLAIWSPGNHWSLYYLWVLSFLEQHLAGHQLAHNMAPLLSCLHLLFISFCDSIAHFFLWLNDTHCKTAPRFIYSDLEGHLAHSPFLAIRNKVAVNIRMEIAVET